MAKRWTDEEIQFLKFAYSDKDLTIKDISEALGRGYKAVHIKAKRLGLEKYKEVLDDNLKRCSRCKTIYKKEFFNMNGERLSSWCKNCSREIWNKKYSLNNNVKTGVVETGVVETGVAETKKCSRCKEIKNVSMFWKNKSNNDGYHWHCKKCASILKKESKLKLLKERGW